MTKVTIHILLKQLQTSGLDERKKLENVLWSRLATEGTPLLLKQENGQYKVTFIYQNPEAKIVSLDCLDLYDRMLDEEGELKKLERIPGTDTFILQLDNIPANVFAPYCFKVDSNTVCDQKSISTYQFDIKNQHTIEHKTSCLQLPDALPPSWVQTKIGDEIAGVVERSDAFSDRDVWIYKSNPVPDKVIFMLDGEEFCKIITPYVDSMSHVKDNPFYNTAIVFVNPDLSKGEPPGRVKEYYINRDDFIPFFAEKIMPEYCDQLNIKNKDNVILAAHSLAAYPMINIATKYTNKIGGVILISPALNLNSQVEIPQKPSTELSELPIFMQIGQLEDATPPEPFQNPQNKCFKDMQNKSRLESNRDFYCELLEHGYNIQSPIKIHPSGHNEIHVIDGIIEGLRLIQDNKKHPSVNYKNQLISIKDLEDKPSQFQHGT